MSYYKILNISPFSSIQEIEDIYKIICLKNENNNLVEKAYNTLSNYQSRKFYDSKFFNDNNITPNDINKNKL